MCRNIKVSGSTLKAWFGPSWRRLGVDAEQQQRFLRDKVSCLPVLNAHSQSFLSTNTYQRGHYGCDSTVITGTAAFLLAIVAIVRAENLMANRVDETLITSKKKKKPSSQPFKQKKQLVGDRQLQANLCYTVQFN